MNELICIIITIKFSSNSGWLWDVHFMQAWISNHRNSIDPRKYEALEEKKTIKYVFDILCNLLVSRIILLTCYTFYTLCYSKSSCTNICNAWHWFFWFGLPGFFYGFVKLSCDWFRKYRTKTSMIKLLLNRVWMKVF